MVRFRIVTLLASVAFAAIWLASLRMEDGATLRRMLWVPVFAVPVLAVLHYRGRQQAFWWGPLVVVVVRGMPKEWPFGSYRVSYTWYTPLDLAQQFSVDQNAAMDTVVLGGTLALCLLCGVISSSIYAHARATER